MSITVRCPGCGKSDAIDEKYAGRRIACKQCGEAMRVRAPEAAPRVRVACESCGKGHLVATEHAGRKTICKNCGATIRIPDSPSMVGRKPTRSRSESAVAAERPAPAALDVYGLEDEPLAPGSGGGPSEALAPTDRAGREDSAPPPPRLKPHKPLSEAQKKKIAKRAEKVDRSRPSNATIGVSFGAVLAFALMGWRMYRIFNRFERAAARAKAAQTASADVDVLDPKVAAAQTDKDVGAMIAQPNTAEARDWLDPAQHTNHAVAEMSAETARAMVAGFYQRGAVKVFVLDPTTLGNTVLTAEIAVQLPGEPAQRKQCLEWAAQYEEGAQPSPDLGQKYLLITTD